MRAEGRISRAVAAIRAGDRIRARRWLEDVVRAEPDSEPGWFWLAHAVESDEERRFCFSQVLRVNRRNALARRELEALGPGPVRSPLEARPVSRRGLPFSESLTAQALGYLLMLALAEILTTFVEPRLGMLLHSLLLTGTLFYGARSWDHPSHRLWLALGLAPLIRLLSLSLPLRTFPLIYWYLIVSIPLFVATAVIRRTVNLSWAEIGLHGRGLLWQLLIAGMGPFLGIVEYRILRPVPLIPALTWREILLPALILLFSTGLLEELIFRGVMQRIALEVMGKWGMVYVAAVFAALHIGHRSLMDVFFVFGVALLFGWFAHRTRSVVGVSLTHGLINIWLFLVVPFLPVVG